MKSERMHRSAMSGFSARTRAATAQSRPRATTRLFGRQRLAARTPYNATRRDPTRRGNVSRRGHRGMHASHGPTVVRRTSRSSVARGFLILTAVSARHNGHVNGKCRPTRRAVVVARKLMRRLVRVSSSERRAPCGRAATVHAHRDRRSRAKVEWDATCWRRRGSVPATRSQHGGSRNEN